LGCQLEYYASWEKVKTLFIYYEDPWDNDHKNIRAHPSDCGPCEKQWRIISCTILKRSRDLSAAANRNPFTDLDELFEPPINVDPGAHCIEGIGRWKESVKEAIDGLPKLSELIIQRRSNRDSG
jgi:hypothetical protein